MAVADKQTDQIVTNAIRYLASELSRAAFHGDEVGFTTSPRHLIGDGRRRTKIIRLLIKQGYLAHIEGEDRDDEACRSIRVTSKAYDDLQEGKPDLIALWNAAKPKEIQWKGLKERGGVSLGELRRGGEDTAISRMYKYICEHRSEFVIRAWNNMPDEPTVELKTIPYPYLDRGSYMISSVELDEHIAKAVKDEEYEEAFLQNLEWAFETTGVLGSKEDAKLALRNLSSFPRGRSEMTREEIEGWYDGVDEKLKHLEDHMIRDAKQIKVLQVIALKVEEMGGWDKFIEKYEADLRTEIEKEAEKSHP